MHGGVMKPSKTVLLIALTASLAAPLSIRADQPSPAAAAAFDQYVATIQQQRPAEPLLDLSARQRLRQGQVLIERLTPPNEGHLPGALLHHWRGSAFVAGATSADFNRVLQNYTAYPAVFSPQVVTADILAHEGDRFHVKLRVRQKHVITVVLDTTYDVTFTNPDPHHASSFSRSTRIAEIASAGSPNEHPLTPSEDHGFLWALDTWWTAEQADGGLYLQVESVSLTRSIPAGLSWIIGPYIESVPRDSLAFTLRSVCRAIHP